MDIHTLQAVIEVLEKRKAMNEHMLTWSVQQGLKEDQQLWSSSLCEIRRALEEVKDLLEAEFKFRDREAA